MGSTSYAELDPKDGAGVRRWYAVWTRSNCESRVSEHLSTIGATVFFPKVMAWGHGPRGRQLAERPLFPGYLFVRQHMDKTTHVRILETQGVVRVLGENWDRLAWIPDDEMMAVERMVSSDVNAFRHHTPDAGEPVRVTDGPLRGLEGRFVRAHPSRGLFVVAITLLHRSIAAEIDAAHVETLCVPTR